MPALIQLDNISVSYGRQAALQEISGAFQEGSLTAIAGPNGAGKSTLLKLLLGIIKPATGTITLSGLAPEDMAYLPQTANLQRDFPITVMQVVCTGFHSKIGDRGHLGKELRQKAQAAIEAVGLKGFENRLIESLSGGQFQRMLFARVIVQDAKLILLDEPFAAVDAETTARLIQLILGWHRERRTIICVLHDLLLIQKYFPDSFVLSGKCLGHGHTHKMLEQRLLSFDLDMAELCAGPETESHHHHTHTHDHAHHAHDKDHGHV